MPRPSAEELRQVRAAERGTAKRPDRDGAEHEALPEGAPDVDPQTPDHASRLEAIQIERRIDQLARREAKAARLEPAEPFYGALGLFPSPIPARHASGRTERRPSPPTAIATTCATRSSRWGHRCTVPRPGRIGSELRCRSSGPGASWAEQRSGRPSASRRRDRPKSASIDAPATIEWCEDNKIRLGMTTIRADLFWTPFRSISSESRLRIPFVGAKFPGEKEFYRVETLRLIRTGIFLHSSDSWCRRPALYQTSYQGRSSQRTEPEGGDSGGAIDDVLEGKT